MQLSLKQRITVPIATLIVVFTATISLVSFWKSRNTVNGLLRNHTNQLCAESIDQIESWVATQRQNVEHWAADPQLAIALKDGAESQRVRDSVSARWANARKVYGHFANIILVNSSGLAVAASNPGTAGTLNVSDRPYFKEALGGRTVVSSILQSRTTGLPAVVIAVPIVENGVVRGVLNGSVDLTAFSAHSITPIKVLQTGYAFMFDEQGVVVAHPDKAQIFKTKLTDYDWGRQILAQRNGEIEYTFKDVDKRVVFRTSDTLHWGLAVTIPMSELTAPNRELGRVNLILSLCALGVGIVVMLFTARSIAHPVLTIVRELTSGADQTNAAASQVSASSQELAQSSSEQASALAQTSAALREISERAVRAAEGATLANQLASDARQHADTGVEDMQAMSNAMAAIESSSNDISKIIKTIDEIAFQTNILALNASVEAARAGQAGLGFAVVAEEVRNLAMRSAQAAKETAEKIEGAMARSRQGAEIGAKVSSSLDQIVANVRRLADLVSTVANDSRSQTSGIAETNTAVGEIDTVTMRISASAEEGAAAAEELNAQAETMKHSVLELVALVEGSRR